jgi:hypothetical protein
VFCYDSLFGFNAESGLSSATVGAATTALTSNFLIIALLAWGWVLRARVSRR